MASGIAPLAVATDGGGSTRIPAACNGVVGLKQSIGMIPQSQVEDAFGNETYVTPTTRTVADTALMMQAMAGEDASDPRSIGIAGPDFVNRAVPGSDPRGWRILFCQSPPGRPVSADVAAAFKASLDRLANLGAELEEFSGDGFDIEPIWRAINHTVWRSRFEKLAADHKGELSDAFHKQLALAANISAVEYQANELLTSTVRHRVSARSSDSCRRTDSVASSGPAPRTGAPSARSTLSPSASPLARTRSACSVAATDCFCA